MKFTLNLEIIQLDWILDMIQIIYLKQRLKWGLVNTCHIPDFEIYLSVQMRLFAIEMTASYDMEQLSPYHLKETWVFIK